MRMGRRNHHYLPPRLQWRSPRWIIIMKHLKRHGKAVFVITQKRVADERQKSHWNNWKCPRIPLFKHLKEAVAWWVTSDLRIKDGKKEYQWVNNGLLCSTRSMIFWWLSFYFISSWWVMRIDNPGILNGTPERVGFETRIQLTLNNSHMAGNPHWNPANDFV